jgi:hypothetical protein
MTEADLKTYLRKQHLAARYKTTERNVDRMARDGRIRRPDLYNGRIPLWDEQDLDEDDRQAKVNRKLAPRNVGGEGA